MMRRIIDARLADCDEDAAMEIGHEHMRRESAGFPIVGYAAVPEPDGGWHINLAWQTPAGVGGRRGRKRWANQSAKVVCRDGL
jgi:hypothetical protein